MGQNFRQKGLSRCSNLQGLKNRGSSLLEFCFIMPILLLVLLYGINLFCVFYTKIDFTIAAFEGTRVAMNNGGNVNDPAITTTMDKILGYLPGSIATAAQNGRQVSVNGQDLTITLSVPMATVLIVGDIFHIFPADFYNGNLAYTYTTLVGS
jgi:hypothetical protein